MIRMTYLYFVIMQIHATRHAEFFHLCEWHGSTRETRYTWAACVLRPNPRAVEYLACLSKIGVGGCLSEDRHSLSPWRCPVSSTNNNGREDQLQTWSWKGKHNRFAIAHQAVFAVNATKYVGVANR